MQSNEQIIRAGLSFIDFFSFIDGPSPLPCVSQASLKPSTTLSLCFVLSDQISPKNLHWTLSDSKWSGDSPHKIQKYFLSL